MTRCLDWRITIPDVPADIELAWAARKLARHIRESVDGLRLLTLAVQRLEGL